MMDAGRPCRSRHWSGPPILPEPIRLHRFPISTNLVHPDVEPIGPPQVIGKPVDRPMEPGIRLVVGARRDAVDAAAIVFDPEPEALLRVVVVLQDPGPARVVVSELSAKMTNC